MAVPVTAFLSFSVPVGLVSASLPPQTVSADPATGPTAFHASSNPFGEPRVEGWASYLKSRVLPSEVKTGGGAGSLLPVLPFRAPQNSASKRGLEAVVGTLTQGVATSPSYLWEGDSTARQRHGNGPAPSGLRACTAADVLPTGIWQRLVRGGAQQLSQ